MNRTSLALTMLSLACVSSCLHAQRRIAIPEHLSPEAKKEYERLANELQEAQAESRKKMMENARKARDGGARSISIRMQRSFPKVADEFLKQAGNFAQSDDAIAFLVQASRLDDRKELVHKIMAKLLAEHIESKRLADAALGLPALARTLGNDGVNAIAAKIIEKSPHKSVQGAAFYARSTLVLDRRGNKSEGRERAIADLRRAVKLAPDVLPARAKGQLYEAEKLQVGMVAPNIVGKDIDDVDFELSDYKGKVIMLDFWGDW